MSEGGEKRSVLVTGANGFLGQHLCLYLAGKGFKLIATSRGESRLPHHSENVYVPVDLVNEQQVEAVLSKFNPDVIVHTAALSKPDECNNDKPLALKVNVDATKFLLKHSTSHFIYISTDFVFGEDGPHSEDDITGPLNFYGETKLIAEITVRNSEHLHAIVRPVFIYGKVWQGLRPSFLHWVKNNLEQGKSIKVMSDQQRTPTYVDDICHGIHAIIDQQATGDYHLAGKDVLSPFEMATITANTLGLDASLIENVTSETFPEPVTRAKKSGLKIDKAIKDLSYNPVSFSEGVKLTFSV